MGIEDILEIETREADDMSAFAKETRRIKPNDLVLVWDDASAERVPEWCF